MSGAAGGAGQALGAAHAFGQFVSGFGGLIAGFFDLPVQLLAQRVLGYDGQYDRLAEADAWAADIIAIPRPAGQDQSFTDRG